MSANLHKTALGQRVNIDQLRLLNEKSVAIGNTNTNARGDQILTNGEIVKPRNQIMKDHYKKSTGPVTRYNPKKRGGMADTTQEAAAIEEQQQPLVQSNLPEAGTEQTLAARASSDLRGSLASSVSLDLTEPTQPNKTIRRI